ncbi:hypothetical protein A2U01_0070363, partial [Trifolium medium]|nr:hypothetical protein [Trifolium medium]
MAESGLACFAARFVTSVDQVQRLSRGTRDRSLGFSSGDRVRLQVMCGGSLCIRLNGGGRMLWRIAGGCPTAGVVI